MNMSKNKKDIKLIVALTVAVLLAVFAA